MSSPAQVSATLPWGAHGVWVRFGGKVALRDVSVRAIPGLVTAVVGGDGAGKTTLLRCLAGVLAPEIGTVRRPAEPGTGYFPASTGTYPELTVAENMAFRSAAYHLRGPAAASRTAELIELAGLSAARDRTAGALSGGMRRKLGVIAAMLHQPELLVLDEPSTGVDPVSRSGLWWLITRAAADGAAVVLSTTYLDDAQRAGAVLVLDAGEQIADGTPEEIIAAMPGSVRAVTERPEGTAASRAWRRGGGWRVWAPPGSDGPGEAKPVDPDLQDAVTVAALARELSLQRGELATPANSDTAATAADSALADAGRRTPATPARPGIPSSAVPAHQPASTRAPRAPAMPAASGDRPLAECVAVTCRFGRFTAVREVSVRIRPGEVVGLLGANGAGKTTLIRMLLGLQRASAGQVMLLGEPPSRRTRNRIGYVPQGLGLYDDLTAAENMAFTAAVFRCERASVPADIARLGAVPAGLLPLGLQRRVAFAAALAHRPDLLILDEPTSGVEPLGRARLWDTIGSAAAGGAGVLVSTHYMEEAGECDRLIVMAGGAVVATGTASEIIGAARVTVVQADHWAAAFSQLAAAGITATLAGRTLRVPGLAAADVAAALQAGGTGTASLLQAPATLEERFFELAAGNGKEPSPA